MRTQRLNRHAIRRIILAIRRPLVRAYATVRFRIVRQRFLEEIGQYLPDEGNVLDVGCGFGLFANFFAQIRPRCAFTGFDLDPGRIEMAREIAAALEIPNVRFEVGDAIAFDPPEGLCAVYMLDILHHIPREEALRFLLRLSERLPVGGRLLIKDVLTEPRHKALFTLVLDRLMVGRGFVRYWTIDEMLGLLRGLGFEAYHHEMVDWLPYPQVLFVARKLRAIDPDRFLRDRLPNGRYHAPDH